MSFHANLFQGEWVHVTFQGKEVCDGWILVEGQSGPQSRNQEVLLMVGAWWRVEAVSNRMFKKVSETWYTMGFGFLGHRVACFILCPPFKMFFGYDYHG